MLQGKEEISITRDTLFKDYPKIEIIEEKYLLSSFVLSYFVSLFAAEESYIKSTEDGMLAQDARGLLPLDTATKCVYTYRIEEWEHFLDLRFRGVTGTPHSNAKIIASKINDIIQSLTF